MRDETITKANTPSNLPEIYVNCRSSITSIDALECVLVGVDPLCFTCRKGLLSFDGSLFLHLEIVDPEAAEGSPVFYREGVAL